MKRKRKENHFLCLPVFVSQSLAQRIPVDPQFCSWGRISFCNFFQENKRKILVHAPLALSTEYFSYSVWKNVRSQLLLHVLSTAYCWWWWCPGKKSFPGKVFICSSNRRCLKTRQRRMWRSLYRELLVIEFFTRGSSFSDFFSTWTKGVEKTLNEKMEEERYQVIMSDDHSRNWRIVITTWFRVPCPLLHHQPSQKLLSLFIQSCL